MFGKRFEEEMKLIEEALKTEAGEKEMIRYISPFVESVVEKYIKDNNISNISKKDLIKAGWTHFHLALKKYKERTDIMLEAKNDIYYFNTYFNWYIRQGIIEYLNSLKKS